MADGGESSGGSAGTSSPHAGASGKGKAGAAGEGGESGAATADGGAAGESSSGGGETGGQAQGGSAGSGPVQPPSCLGDAAALKCGVNLESCCTSLTLPGQSFSRSYDAISPEYQDSTFPAAVTSFRLDKFEVTVGRFRQFVAAVVGSWRPKAGDGKHSHLNDGAGLKNIGTEGGNEAGWDVAWNKELASKAAAWNTNLVCDPQLSSWTPTAGSKELLPVSCVNWYEAYAFCIWDEGFLPSEAEWNDAASGGSLQRAYPWSIPATSLVIDCKHSNYKGKDNNGELDYCVSPGNGSVAPVGSSPLGDGLWGHADLAGNVFEWTLDSFADYTHSCPDCVNSDALKYKVIRGGGYPNDAAAMLVSVRGSNTPDARSKSAGLRCARILPPQD